MADKSGTSAQAVALPTGGGDVRGLGESFSPDLNSGTGNYRVALDLPPGVRNLQPPLSLVYSTGGGNGPFGLGWALAHGGITRRTFRGVPTYDDRDTFLYNGAAQLVPMPDGTYRPAVEHAFERVRRVGEHWEVTDKSGVRHTFGTTGDSRIEVADGAVFAWLPERTEDPFGNAITYRYEKDGAQAYLVEVSYAVYSVRMTYEPRPDPHSDFRSGFELLTRRRCSRIDVIADPLGSVPFRSWVLEYTEATDARTSLLSGITLTGTDPDTGETLSLPPLELTYTAFGPERRRYRRISAPAGPPPGTLGDGNADLIDLDGIGLPGVVRIENGSARYWPNDGAFRWGAPRSLPRLPADLSLAQDRVRLADMDGDGAVDVLVGAGPFSGYHENTGREWGAAVRYPRSPQLRFEEGDVHLLDVDGDGLVDAVRSLRTGLQVFPNRGPAGWDEPRLISHAGDGSAPPPLHHTDRRVRLADLNGDGLLDVVHIASGRIEYWPCRGNGRFGTGRVMTASPRLPHPVDPARIALADVNGDGLADVIYVGYDTVTYWINQGGNAFAPPRTVRLTPPTPDMAAVRTVDLTGSGAAGILWTSPFPEHRFLDLIGGTKPGLLTKIDNHLGQVIEVSYTTSAAEALADRADGRPWSSFLPFSVQLVASVTVRDTVRGTAATTGYRYHDGHFDGHRREFDGFARAEQIEAGDGGQPAQLTVFSFHTEESARSIEPDPTLRRALKRKLFRVEVFGLDGSDVEALPYRVEESRWALRVEQHPVDALPVVFPHVAEAVTTTSERGVDARVERRLFTYDDVGNVVVEERIGQGAPAGPDLFVRTEVEYARNDAEWLVDRAARIVVRNGTGNLLSETRHYYDGANFTGLPLGQVGRGHLARTERVAITVARATALYGPDGPDLPTLGYLLGQDADGEPVWLVQQERRRADSRGNIVASRNARGNDNAFAFDAHGLFPTSVTEANGRTATMEHDVRFGRPRRLVDPNGAESLATYDPLGRLRSVVAPGDTLAAPTVRFAYETAVLPASRVTTQRIETGSARTLTVAEYLDGAGEVYQRRTQHDAATFVVSGEETRNARGKTARKHAPFHAGSAAFAPYPVTAAVALDMSYDALGRPALTRMPTEGVSSAEHEAFRTVLRDPGDGDPGAPSFDTPKVEHYDAWHRLVAVEDGPAGARQITRYQLDQLGRLAQVTDARGVVLTRLEADLLGRRIAVDHADAGLRLLAYDADGNLAWTRNAAGQVVTHTFDGLSRLTQVSHDGTVVEELTYDLGVGSNLVGRLAHVTDQAGKTTYSYDERGNVVERTRAVPGEPAPFVAGFSYDRLGRVSTVTYPDGHEVAYDYAEGFLLRRVPGYVDAVEYAPSGIRTAVQYANGVRTDYTYDAGTSRLGRIRTWAPGSGEVHYDAALDVSIGGDVRAINDLRASPSGLIRDQAFELDAHGRLLRAEGADAAGSYVQEFAYDATGNLLRNPLISPEALTYTPGTNKLTGAGAVTMFDHDANGNLTVLPGRRLTFNARGQLESVLLDDGTQVRYAYDHRGFLARKDVTPAAGPSRRSLYFDMGFELDESAAVRLVYAGDLLVAVDRDGTRSFVHNDHLLSAVVFTADDGTAAAEIGYYPFGAPTIPPATSGRPSFTKRRLDNDTGLYYLQARWYAPDLGRFVSPDPLFVLKPEEGIQEPQRLNPYAYAGNNPVRYADPSGLGFWDVVGAIAIVIVVAAAVVVTAGLAGVALGGVGVGTALAYAGAAGLAGAAIGAVVGGITHGSWQGALTGALIGFTAGANAMLGGMIFGPVVGGILGLVNFLALFPPIARSDAYQGVPGWSSYFMPMSWPGHAIGLLLFVANVVPYVVTLGQVDAVRIRDLRVDWRTGNIFTVGGWVGNVPDRAFNFGAFSFVNTSRYIGGEIAPATFEHESGHMLNNAAFGFFQAARVFEGDALNSYWERLAESNVPPGLRGSDPTQPEPDRPRIPLWSS